MKLALNRLIAEQVIDNYPRQGIKVHSLNSEEVREIFDIRLMMDLYYAKEVIDTIAFNRELRDAMYRNVEEHLEIVGKIADTVSVQEYISNYNYDYKFHELYLKCSGNQKILDVYRSINPFVYCNYIFHRQSKEKDIAGVEEHREILQAIFD